MNSVYIIFGIGFVCLLSYVATRIYKEYKNKLEQKTFMENKEFLKLSASKLNSNLYYFYTDWCPHCKSSMEVWDSIENNIEFDKFNLNFFKIECDDKKNKATVKEFNIKEYPTIILLLNGKKYIYDADLNTESINKFLIAVYKKHI